MPNPSLQLEVNVRRPSGNLDSAFRRSSVPVRTPRSVARTLPCQGCHVAKSPSLAGSFARNRLFRGFLKVCTFDGCASGGRDGEYSESARSTGYQNLKTRSTLGACVLFCFRVPVRSGAPAAKPHLLWTVRTRGTGNVVAYNSDNVIIVSHSQPSTCDPRVYASIRTAKRIAIK